MGVGFILSFVIMLSILGGTSTSYPTCILIYTILRVSIAEKTT